MINNKMFVVLPWRIAEALVDFIISQGGIDKYELRSGSGNTFEEICNTRTVVVRAESSGPVEEMINKWLAYNDQNCCLELWVEPVEWPVENPYLTKAAMDEITELIRRSDSEGGTVDCICEGCGKWMKGYLEPLPYGTVRIGRPHWFCPECVRKWSKEN